MYGLAFIARLHTEFLDRGALRTNLLNFLMSLTVSRIPLSISF